MGIDHLGRHLFSVGISTFCTPSGFFTGPKDPLRCLKYHARNLILKLPSYFSKVKDICCKRSITKLRTLYKSVSGKNDPHHLIVRQTRKICRNLSHLVITTPLIKVTWKKGEQDIHTTKKLMLLQRFLDHNSLLACWWVNYWNMSIHTYNWNDELIHAYLYFMIFMVLKNIECTVFTQKIRTLLKSTKAFV